MRSIARPKFNQRVMYNGHKRIHGVKFQRVGNICNYFTFIDFKRQMKVNLSPVGKKYFVCALQENARTCLYGNQVSEKFEIAPPSINEYFSW